MKTSDILVAIFASTGFWTVLNTLLTNHINKTKTKDKTADLLKEADIAILHDRIYLLCKKALKDGEISIEDYHNIECLTKPYFDLGGNGTAHKLWEDVQGLPISDE